MSYFQREDTPDLAGLEMIAAERLRQIIEKKYTPELDDQHTEGELALAAALLASPILLYKKQEEGDSTVYTDPWPKNWDRRWDKRPYHGGKVRPNNDVSLGTQDRIRQLEKAGALIAAEIDRLLRAQEKVTQQVAEDLPVEV